MSTPQRNVDLPDGDGLDAWPYEGLVTLIERGDVRDWARLTRRVRADPWGPVARQIEDYLGYAEETGVTALLRRAVAAARADAARRERAAVAAEVDALVRSSGLSAADFAVRIGTSASRLSTYRTGAVTPSAALVVRMRALTRDLRGESSTPPPLHR